MKTIETPRLLLRKSTLAEYTAVFEAYTEAEAMVWMGTQNIEEFQQAKAKYDGGMKTYRTDFVHFHLIEKATQEVIGDCCFHTWYTPHARAEIGYGIKKEQYKGKGYMKEALAAVLHYGFTEMGLNRIEAFASPANTASTKLLLGAGFTEEGLLQEHYFINGAYLDSMVFGLLKKNFSNRQG